MSEKTKEKRGEQEVIGEMREIEVKKRKDGRRKRKEEQRAKKQYKEDKGSLQGKENE